MEARPFHIIFFLPSRYGRGKQNHRSSLVTLLYCNFDRRSSLSLSCFESCLALHLYLQAADTLYSKHYFSDHLCSTDHVYCKLLTLLPCWNICHKGETASDQAWSCRNPVGTSSEDSILEHPVSQSWLNSRLAENASLRGIPRDNGCKIRSISFYGGWKKGAFEFSDNGRTCISSHVWNSHPLAATTIKEFSENYTHDEDYIMWYDVFMQTIITSVEYLIMDFLCYSKQGLRLGYIKPCTSFVWFYNA